MTREFDIQLLRALTQMQQEGVSGEVLTLDRVSGGLFLRVVNPLAYEALPTQVARHEMIIFDCANDQGGKWKWTFYPSTEQFMLVNERLPRLAADPALAQICEKLTKVCASAQLRSESVGNARERADQWVKLLNEAEALDNAKRDTGEILGRQILLADDNDDFHFYMVMAEDGMMALIRHLPTSGSDRPIPKFGIEAVIPLDEVKANIEARDQAHANVEKRGCKL